MTESRIERENSIVRQLLRAVVRLAAQGDRAIKRDPDGVHWMRLAAVTRAAHLPYSTASRVISARMGHPDLVPVRNAGTPLDYERLRYYAEQAGVDLTDLIVDTAAPGPDGRPILIECARLIAGESSAFRMMHGQHPMRFLVSEAADRADMDAPALGRVMARLGLWDRTAPRANNWSRIGRPLHPHRFFLWLREQGNEVEASHVAQALGQLERVGKRSRGARSAPTLTPLQSRAKAQRELRAGCADVIERDARARADLLERFREVMTEDEITAAEVEIEDATCKAEEIREYLKIADDIEFLTACGAGLPPIQIGDQWRPSKPEDWREPGADAARQRTATWR